MTDDERCTVLLLGVPTGVHVRSTAHLDALFRELVLVLQDERTQPDPVRDLARELRSLHQRLSGAIHDELAPALTASAPRIDLAVGVPASLGAVCRRLDELLDEAEQLCRTGDRLVTTPASDDELRYRRWFLGQLTAQLDGGEATPWPGGGLAGDADPTPAAEPALPPGWAVHGLPDRPVMSVADDLDLLGSTALQAALPPLLQGGVIELTADLRRVVFIDSVGIGVLVATHLRAAELGMGFVVLASPSVRSTLAVAGLESVMDIRA